MYIPRSYSTILAEGHGQEKGGDRKRAPVPEQMMFWLSGPGLVGLAGMRRFNR
jgi:hypothetical protein